MALFQETLELQARPVLQVPELKKAKVILTLQEESEWLGYFTAEKAKAQALQAQIDKTDKEIDALVYALYGLTEEEIKVVEGKN